MYAERVEVWYAQKLVETLPRLRGRGKHRIDYRHVIDWLVRKPGAFADYRYREDLFPSSRFRLAYDVLRAAAAGAGGQGVPADPAPGGAARARRAWRRCWRGCWKRAAAWMRPPWRRSCVGVTARFVTATAVTVAAVDLASYDALLEGKEAEDGDGQGREGDAGGRT